ncbi:hypothetical protein J2X20_002935 [Pelomonas saccharophila]|jgi:hypothetical protein|uniref:DUF4337 domain-containing protein n=1 Tax=Roseateles saccharophilus TaxID=304 RepID=A0ABU1YN44_ROSSA|nr:DUF4337 domain-containing protein [Roseateles saccharophilus]MDR7270277.1 hypothetical protein [Roseateles saccharophilus]
MDLDPKDLVDQAAEAAEAAQEARTARLNAAVAITVAVLATFMGICKVKDDNIVQGMQQAQADKLDYWAYFQARTIRADVAEQSATQLELAKGGAPAAQAADYDKAIAAYRAKTADQLKKRDELKAQAEAAQTTYETLNRRDDQFDLSDALLAIAIALLAVTALTRLWPLYFVALLPTFFGVLMGVAGLGDLPIHPNMLFRLLS